MKDFGYIRIKTCVPEVRIGDIGHNTEEIIREINKAESEAVDILLFPELSVTGYTCGDLFNQELLIRETEDGIKRIIESTSGKKIFIAVGAPVLFQGVLYNCAVAVAEGRLLGLVPKTHLPNYIEFYEKRWFKSGKDLNGLMQFCGFETRITPKIYFTYKCVNIGIEICEDLWVPSPPSDRLSLENCEVILNLSASDAAVGKKDYISDLIRMQSARCRCAYAYASAGKGESSSDLVFQGNSMIGVDGRLYEGKREVIKDVDIEKLRLDRMKFNTFFDNASLKYNSDSEYENIVVGSPLPNECHTTDEEDSNHITFSRGCAENDSQDRIRPDVHPLPFVPSDKESLDARCEEIIGIQVAGLCTRLRAINCHKLVVGISGGLDSTLALLVASRAFKELDFDSKGIIGITMPGLATTSRTKSNAHKLMELLGVTSLTIPIEEAVKVHFKDIGQNPDKYDVTFENSQARERTQILMDVANKENAIVLGTGDMSELALGWCTYNGDHMSMYGVNAGVPKTLVRHLVRWFANESTGKLKEVLEDVLDTPISPELIPSKDDNISQKTEDLVGPYELHDFFLYHFLRNSFSPKKIYWLACHAFKNQFSSETILKWLKVFYRRFFSQQFKRNAMPDGPKVGSVSLSPRGDWRMPSDASARMWLKELEEI